MANPQLIAAPLVRLAGVCLLIPIAVVVVLLGVLALYVAALYHGVRQIACALIDKREPVEYAKPHFLESSNSIEPYPKMDGKNC